MKYIISESRLDKIIFKYLESRFRPYKIKNIDLRDDVLELGQRKTVYNSWDRPDIWVVNDAVVAVFAANGFLIDENIFKALIMMFSLDDKRAKIYITKYMNELGFDIIRPHSIRMGKYQKIYNEQYNV